MSKNWKGAAESQFFVLRESHTGGDHRIAFAPGLYKDFGPCHNPTDHNETKLFATFGNWTIGEETGILVIRDKSSAGDHRFAFWPGCGNNINFGTPGHQIAGGDKTYKKGPRWHIREENGVLV